MSSKGRKEVSGDFDQNDREAAVKHLMQIPYVGKKTAGILYDNGFKSIRQIQSADEQTLAMVSGIGKKLGRKIKGGADELEVVGGREEPQAPADDAPPEEEKAEEAPAEEPAPQPPEPVEDLKVPEAEVVSEEPVPAYEEQVAESVPAHEEPAAEEEPPSPPAEPAAEEVPAEREEPQTAIEEVEPSPIVEAEPEPREEPKDDDLPYEVPEEKGRDETPKQDEGQDELADAGREEQEPAHDSSLPQKDAASMLLQWQLDGFDVSSVEKMIFGDGVNQDEVLGQFTLNIRKLDGLKEEIGRREFPKNMDEDVKAMLAMLNDPMRVGEIAARLEQLDGMKRAKIVEAELESLEGMEKEKEEIRALLSDPSKIGHAEVKVKKLKRAKKESFFELEFTKNLQESEAPAIETKRVVIDSRPAIVKSRVPMVVEAVFLTSSDGKPMSFRTRKPRSEVGMNWLKGAAGAVRMLVVTSKEKEGDAFDGTFEGAKTLVCRGEMAWLGIVFAGEEHPLGRRMLKTALGVMEAKHYHDLKGWDGKSGVTSVGKSMNAIIPAFIKLNRMAKA